MSIKIKSSLNEIKKSIIFKEWKKNHKSSYLCNLFITDEIQFSFYNPETDKITSFKKCQNEINMIGEEEIFKTKESIIEELKLKDVKLDLEKAIEKVKRLMKKKYKHEKESKLIIVLQTMKNPIWNITCLTKNFNILNVKLDAKNGRIISDQINAAAEFRAVKQDS